VLRGCEGKWLTVVREVYVGHNNIQLFIVFIEYCVNMKCIIGQCDDFAIAQVF